MTTKLTKKINRNWQQSRQSLAWPQYYVFNCVCNNDSKRKSNIAGPKNLKMKTAFSSVDLQDTGNQIWSKKGK